MKKPYTLLLLALAAVSAYASEIRVRNDSKVDFKDVIVGDKKYGDIKSGATTDYQTWETAYSYSFVSLFADSKSLRLRPYDYVGETPLGDGRFTYVITVKDNDIEIRAEKDKGCLSQSVATSGDSEIQELATQAHIYTATLNPQHNQQWVDGCLNLNLDVDQFGCKIIAYRIQWFNGNWSGWFVPGVNDLYKKPGEPLRRFWACFNDHSFGIIYQTTGSPMDFINRKGTNPQ